MLAVDARTGRALWRRRLGFRTGTVLVHGGILLTHGGRVGDVGDRIWAIDGRTGRVLHSILLPAFGTTDIATVKDALWVACAGGALIVVPPWLTRRLQSG